MAEFSFLVPPGPLSIEGGGAYVGALAAALTAAGHGVVLGADPPPGPLPGRIRVIDGAALATLPVADMAGAVAVIHHTTPLADPSAQEALKAAERERLPLLHRIVATSEAVRERLVGEFGANPDRIAVVRPGVPDAPRSPGSGGPDCAVLSVGALVPRKGHDVLLQALARLFDLPWRLVIVGDGVRDKEHAGALRRLADQAGIAGRVRFAGALDAAGLAAEWQRADVFALATQWEGYSAPVAEALRRGMPVAVTNGGAAAELVGPQAGVVVNPGDHDGLSKAMRRVIFDGALRAEMAEAAWCTGQTLPDWPAQALRFVEVTA